MAKVLPKATLIYREDITADLTIMRFEPENPFSFKPGQYCTIGIEGVTVRPYSIASTPDDPYLELFIRLVPEGEFTPELWKLRVGDQVNLLPKAKGVFTFESAFENQVMIATTTGTAPFISILRTQLRYPNAWPKNLKRFYLFHGASYQTEFTGYHFELRDMFPNLVYVPTVSRPDEPENIRWPGRTGRVNTLCEDLLHVFNISTSSTIVYLCGNPGMIDDLESKLTRLGYQTKLEKYWHDK